MDSETVVVWVNITAHPSQRVERRQNDHLGRRKYHLRNVGCAVYAGSSSVAIPTAAGVAAEVGLVPCLNCCACPISRRMPPDDQVESSTEALRAGAGNLRVIKGGRGND